MSGLMYGIGQLVAKSAKLSKTSSSERTLESVSNIWRSGYNKLRTDSCLKKKKEKALTF